jgi:hypothetical protein
MEASAAALAKSGEKASAKHESFGQQLALAVKAKLHPRQPHFIAESPPGFGEQIKKAVEKKQGGCRRRNSTKKGSNASASVTRNRLNAGSSGTRNHGSALRANECIALWSLAASIC